MIGDPCHQPVQPDVHAGSKQPLLVYVMPRENRDRRPGELGRKQSDKPSIKEVGLQYLNAVIT
jgi:hypothetical protein